MFKGLYEVVNKSENSVEIKLSDKKHPIFKAHFPLHPVLPGFVHFEIVADIFNLEVTSIKKAKYMALIKPKELLRYEKNANKFRVFRGDEEVASFTL
jgi:3-hydroxyacyl-[acyl-carrier-protein] dehydratase